MYTCVCNYIKSKVFCSRLQKTESCFCFVCITHVRVLQSGAHTVDVIYVFLLNSGPTFIIITSQRFQMKAMKAKTINMQFLFEIGR
jgi:hypothetical protein